MLSDTGIIYSFVLTFYLTLQLKVEIPLSLLLVNNDPVVEKPRYSSLVNLCYFDLIM